MSDFDYMVECLERDMVVMLVEKRGMNMSQALDAFYNSETYEKLRDVRSGLFFQSSGYVYDFLDHEMNYGKFF